MCDEVEIGVRDMANALRILSADAVEAAHARDRCRWHGGYRDRPLHRGPEADQRRRAQRPDRDRFVLSNGHGSMLQYSLLHLTGYEGMPLKDIRAFRQRGSLATGHPERGEPLGVETTTGPLGQGVANAVGMALAESFSRLAGARTSLTIAPMPSVATAASWKVSPRKPSRSRVTWGFRS